MSHGQAHERVEIPDAIEQKMKAWRAGFIGLPKEYIEWHRELATKAKALLVGYRVVMEQMIDDGWADGMRFLALTVLNKKTNQLSVIKWADSQFWYEFYPSGGWGFFRPEPVVPTASVTGLGLVGDHAGKPVVISYDHRDKSVAAALGQ